MKAKIVIGKTYYHPLMEKEFTLNEKLEDGKIKSTYEDGIEKIWTRKELRESLKHWIENYQDHPKWKDNLTCKNAWTIDLVKNEECDPSNIMSTMLDNLEPSHTLWLNSDNGRFYALCNQTKGRKACEAFCCYMEGKGIVVPKKPDGEYDFDIHRIIKIDDTRYIIRSACILEDADKLMLNHIRWQDDWDILIAYLVFPDRIELYQADRDDIDLFLDEYPDQIVEIANNSLNVHHWNTEYPLADVFIPFS